MPARKNLTGQIFGPLTVLKLDEEKTKQQKRGWNTEAALKETQKRDNYKKQWCKDNNKTLIVIPFTDFEKININSLLGKEKEYIYYEKRFM